MSDIGNIDDIDDGRDGSDIDDTSDEEFEKELSDKYELLHSLAIARRYYSSNQDQELRLTVHNSYDEIKQAYDSLFLEETRRKEEQQTRRLVTLQLCMIRILYPDLDIPSYTQKTDINDLIRIRDDVASSESININLFPSFEVMCAIMSSYQLECGIMSSYQPECPDILSNTLSEYKQLIIAARAEGGNDRLCDMIEEKFIQSPSKQMMECIMLSFIFDEKNSSCILS